MAISLAKGQKISLTKDNAGLSKVRVGLGWDQVKKSSGGLFGSLFGGSAGGAEIDIDASVFMLGENGKAIGSTPIVYFGKLASDCGSIRHAGDNRTGAGDGDDETIIVDLSRVPSNVHKLSFVVNIYNGTKNNQHFGMIENAFIRLVDDRNGSELIRYNLTDDYNGKLAVFVADMYRDGSEWKFSAVGEGTTDTGLNDMSRRFK